MDPASESTAGEPASRSWGEWAFSLFLVVACLVLAVLVVLLARENRRLEAELAAATRQVPAQAWRHGDSLGPLALVNEQGITETFLFDRREGRTLLLIFSLDCPACEQTFPFWEFLVEGAAPGVRVLGLNVGESRPPALGFPVYSLPDAERESLRRVPLVPATLLVDAEGRVARAWYGALETEDEEALLDALGGASLHPE